MKTPAEFQDIDAKKTAQQAWGTSVDIAEILRENTLNEISQCIMGLHWEETIQRTGSSTMEGAMAILAEEYRSNACSDTSIRFAMSLANNLLRSIPLDEFLYRNAQDIMNQYGRSADLDVPEKISGADMEKDRDFWHGMLKEGREIITSYGGLFRVYLRVMEMTNVTPQQLEADQGIRINTGAKHRERAKIVCEHAVRNALASRIPFSNLFERDRALDTIHHIIMEGKEELMGIIDNEKRLRLNEENENDSLQND